MHLSQFHYLPLAPGFFSILIALFVGLLVIMVVFGALRHAYLSLGVSPGTAMLLLLGSLIGSYFNGPLIGDVTFTQKANGTIDVVDRDNNYPAWLGP